MPVIFEIDLTATVIKENFSKKFQTDKYLLLDAVVCILEYI